MKKIFYFLLSFVILLGCILISEQLFSYSSYSSILKFGTLLNTTEDDFSPSIGNNGQVLIFDSKTKKGDTDIYIAVYTNGEWVKPKPFEWLNTEFNEETPYISNDSNIILFSSNRKHNREKNNPMVSTVQLTYDIFISYFEENIWQKPERLQGSINTILNERCPSLSNDNKTIYFSRWELENIHQAKVMKAKIDVFSVKDEKPLPSVINSGHGDIAFSPAENLGGFFFSSMRPGGFGGWDLYFISYKNNKWGTPVNLGPDINTIWHEMFITQNGKVYYFSSNRQGGIGYYDIYGINSSSIATNKEMYRARMENKRKMNAMADVKPDYMESFRGENRVERIYIRTQKMTNKEGRESESDFPLVYFDYQSAKLKSKYNPQLNEIASYLKTNTDKSLKIIGHTDERGGDDYNCNLSFNRAKSVLNYLVGKNIKKKRLKILPMGKKMPLQSQDGEEETNAKNRRVEFNIIDN